MNNSLFSSALPNKNTSQNPSFSQAELVQRLVEIGEQLRQTRQHQSLSINMVAAYTLIRVPLLHALEQGQLEYLPEPVYTQGLIKRYADALGLNGSDLAQFFLPEPIEPSVKSPLKLLSLPPLRPTHLYLTYILLVICAVNGLSYLVKSNPLTNIPNQPIVANASRSDPAQSSTSNPNSTVIEGQLVAQSNEAVAGHSVSSEVKATSNSVEIALTVKDESWVLIEIDGKTEFQGILAGGTQQSWKASKEVVVVAGNAGGVLITVNNGEAKRLGEPGMVEEVVFTSENPSSQAQNPKS
ncbi:MAG: RodZ domain-containing protein [Microcoleaceae cyanobacterium]